MSLFLHPTFPSPARHNCKHLTQRSFTRPFLQTSCLHKQPTTRRTALIGLGLTATFTTNRDLPMAASASESQILPDFGSEARQLNKLIRVRVPRPKSSSGNGETVEVVVVEDIEIPNDESVRFDVYVAKAVGGGNDLGELAGSLVQDGRLRTGRNYRKSGLNLGIGNLVRRIGCDGCEELVVSLVPRAGELSIGGLRIDLFNNQ